MKILIYWCFLWMLASILVGCGFGEVLAPLPPEPGAGTMDATVAEGKEKAVGSATLFAETPAAEGTVQPEEQATLFPLAQETESRGENKGQDPTVQPTLTPLPAGEPVVIGWSVEGRPLEVYRFGQGEHAKMIVAGIHGGYEWNTVRLAQELLAHLQMYPWVVPEDVTLYLMPNFNPDGYALQHGKLGRANANGVDLNRNWDANWQPDWPRTGCWDLLPITAGASPHSEPEVQALAAFILERQPEALISYHSAALGIFPGGTPPTAGSMDLAQKLADVSGYAYPPVATGCEYTGQFANWAANHGIPAVDIELTNHSETDYDLNILVLNAFLHWRSP